MPISVRAHAAPRHPLSTGTGRHRRVVSSPAYARTNAGEAEAVMEIAPSPLQQQQLGDSFSHGWLPTNRGARSPSLDRLVAYADLGDSFSNGWLPTNRGARSPSLDRLVACPDLGHSFGTSTRSFIDMDPAELFSMRWTTTGIAMAPPESDFDFGIIPGGGVSDPPSPVLVSASRVIHDGRLLPSDPAGIQERAADPPSAPLFRSASLPASPSPCPRTAGRRVGGGGGGGGGGASSWKILLQYLRFLVPLYRKVRAMRRFPAPRRPRPRVAPAASPARASTSTSSSSIEWCHGNADTAVRDAILYCKKSSGQDD